MAVRLGPALTRTLRQGEDEARLVVKPQLTRYLNHHHDLIYDRTVVDRVTQGLVRPSESRSARFGASSAGGCPRAQVLSYLGAPGFGVDNGLQMIFEDGKWRHMRLQALLLQSGIISEIEVWSWWRRKRAGGQVDGYGYVPDDHPDVSLRGKDFGLEIKGANMWPFKQAEKHGLAGLMNGKYLHQVARYFLFTGYDVFVVLVENKDTQELLEWVITDRDVDMAGQERELDALNQAVDQQQLPAMLPACGRGKGPDFRGCVYGQSTENTCHQIGDWPADWS